MTRIVNVFAVGVLLFGAFAFAEETTIEKMNTSKNKAVVGVKEAYRDTKDKVCEMVNGKTECVVKKIKNKAQTLKEKVETKATETKDKVD